MAGTRRARGAAFRAKVVLAASKSDRTTAQLASHGFHTPPADGREEAADRPGGCLVANLVARFAAASTLNRMIEEPARIYGRRLAD